MERDVHPGADNLDTQGAAGYQLKTDSSRLASLETANGELEEGFTTALSLVLWPSTAMASLCQDCWFLAIFGKSRKML
jgi:hypothetical protein